MSVKMRWVSALMPAMALGLVLSGCGKKDEGGGKTGGGDGTGTAKKALTEAKVSGYATALKGHVTYNGPADKIGPRKLPQTKEPPDKCPSEVNGEGWYVKDPATKGLQYAVVYLRAPSGTRMPKWEEKDNQPAGPFIEIRQPKCQFEPRVQVMHPSQKLKAHNDSDISHNTSLGGPSTGNSTIPPRGAQDFDLNYSNREPTTVFCTIHTGTMSAYIWKFEHPWAAVTDENGNYEIKNVPVLDGAQLELWVWHEMMDPKTKKIGAIDVKAGEAATKDFAIPN
jgi:hypothetical protein